MADFRQPAMTIEATPAFLGGFGELEDHGERRLVRQTSLGAHCAVAHRRERAFDQIRRAQVLQCLAGEPYRQQRGRCLGKHSTALSYLKGVKRSERVLLGFRHSDLLRRPLGLRLLALRQQFRTFAVLCTQRNAGRAPSATPPRSPARSRARSATASSGSIASPRRFRSRSNSLQDCGLRSGRRAPSRPRAWPR